MADLESFGGLDSQESIDPQAVERMRERMKAAAAQMKKDRKQEQKQQKKEDKLAKIIAKFLQKRNRNQIMTLVLRCLEQNVTPVFVLAIITLVEAEVREDLFNSPASSTTNSTESSATDSSEQVMLIHPDEEISNKALAHVGADSSLPLKARIQFETWIKHLYQVANERGVTIPNTITEANQEIKVCVIQLMSFVIREFLSKNSIEGNFLKIQSVSNFFLKGICKKIAEQKAFQSPQAET